MPGSEAWGRRRWVPCAADYGAFGSGRKTRGIVFDFSGKELTDLGVLLLLTSAVGWSGQVRRRAQRLASRQAAQLLEEARLKDHFLATLAHELRNPLAPLRTGLELLQMAGDDLADKALVGEVRVMMQRQVDQLVRLIDDLLDMSRINTGKIELRRASKSNWPASFAMRSNRRNRTCAQPGINST